MTVRLRSDWYCLSLNTRWESSVPADRGKYRMARARCLPLGREKRVTAAAATATSSPRNVPSTHRRFNAWNNPPNVGESALAAGALGGYGPNANGPDTAPCAGVEGLRAAEFVGVLLQGRAIPP